MNIHGHWTETQRRLSTRREVLRRLRNPTTLEATQLKEEQDSTRRDGAQTLEEADVRATLRERERRELVEVEAALARLDDGSYGRCESCSGAIGRQRLIAVPEARLCLSCASPQLRQPLS